MATITATIDNGGMSYPLGRVTGTFTSTDNQGGTVGLAGPAVDQIVLLPTTCYLTSFFAVCERGPVAVRARCNVNSSLVAANGTVAIETNLISNETFRFQATFLGS